MMTKRKHSSLNKRPSRKSPRDKITGKMIQTLHKQWGMSRKEFASTFNIAVRTLDKNKQGALIPSNSSSLLFLLAKHYPDTRNRLKKCNHTIKARTIKQLRKKFGLSRKVFASKIGASWKSLAKWERGEVPPLSTTTLLLSLINQYPDTLKRIEKIAQ